MKLIGVVVNIVTYLHIFSHLLTVVAIGRVPMTPARPSKLEEFGRAVDLRTGQMVRGARRETYFKKKTTTHVTNQG